MKNLVGTVLGRFQLVELIGSSRQGDVYKGLQEELNREVAIRVLLPEQARDSQTLVRFRQESRTTAQLSHPHILTVYDSGKRDELRYLVMELLDPETLAARLAREPQLPLEEALRIAEELTSALEYMHSRKLLHGMIVPSNVRFDLRGNTVLTGIGTEPADRLLRIQELGVQNLASPEILMGNKVGPASDLYQIGGLLYLCLCGRPPYAGRPPFVAGGSNFESKIPRPRSLRKEISEDLEKLILKCLMTSPQYRSEDAPALQKEIARARRRVQVRQVSRNVAARTAPSEGSPRPPSLASSVAPGSDARPPWVTALELLTGGYGDIQKRETKIRLALLAAPVLLTGLVLMLYLSGAFSGTNLRVLESKYDAGERQITVSWKANQPCYGFLEFHRGETPVGQTQPSQASQTIFNQSMVGLEPGTRYSYYICLSSSPNGASVVRSTPHQVQTRDPLTVLDVRTSSRQEREVTLTWKTNRPADTRIRFWRENSPPLEIENPEFERDLSHQITLRGLLPGSTYLYQLLAREPSTDGKGLESEVHRFSTTVASRDITPRQEMVESALAKLRNLDHAELSKLEASLGEISLGKGDLNMEQRALLAMTRTRDADSFFRRRSLAARWAEQRAKVGARQPELPPWSPRKDFPATLAYLKDYYSATQDRKKALQRLDECIHLLAESEGLPTGVRSP